MLAHNMPFYFTCIAYTRGRQSICANTTWMPRHIHRTCHVAVSDTMRVTTRDFEEYEMDATCIVMKIYFSKILNYSTLTKKICRVKRNVKDIIWIEIYTPESVPEKKIIHFSHVIYTHLYLSKQITRYFYDLSSKYMCKEKERKCRNKQSTPSGN